MIKSKIIELPDKKLDKDENKFVMEAIVNYLKQLGYDVIIESGDKKDLSKKELPELFINIHKPDKTGFAEYKTGSTSLPIQEGLCVEIDYTKRNTTTKPVTNINTTNRSSGILYPTTITRDSGIALLKEAPSVVIDFDINNLDNKELFKIIEKLKLENLELKTEVEYLEKYVEYLETNYSFILKDSKLAKEIFNVRTKGGNHE